MNRRMFLEVVGSLMLAPNPMELTATPVKKTAQSIVWKIGPPGRGLVKFAEQLAQDGRVGGSVWVADEAPPDDADEDWFDFVGGHYEFTPEWAWKINQCAAQPLVLDDIDLRGDNWTSAEQRLENFAKWAKVRIKLEQ